MIPKRIVAAVLERDRGMCQLRGPNCLGDATVADHRANRGMGGSKVLNTPACLVSACGVCNGEKETATGDELQRLIAGGLRVLPASTHAGTVQRCRETPVFINGKYVLLDDEGGETLIT